MRKSFVAVSMALGLAVTALPVVQSAEMEGMKMDQPVTKSAVNQTKGVVKELDAKKGTVTLSHDPVPTLKWPAMTMAFKISPELAKGIEVGQKVDFEFQTQGMAATITKIAPSR